MLHTNPGGYANRHRVMACFGIVLLAALIVILAGCGGSAANDPLSPTTSSAWSFAVMADTQWIGADDGNNPNSVAVSVINQLNQQFINQKVKFVVQVGDLTDDGSNKGLQTRALYAQALYNAGIGFYPLRGNHESSAAGATEFLRVFPQTQNGSQNSSPSDVTAGTFIPAADASNQPFAAKTGAAFTMGSSFSSPDPYSNGNLKGLSYAFDYNNARFVLLDMFTPPTGTNKIDDQQSWINAQLSGRSSGTHAFVFSHKGLITENHKDTLFGANPAADATGQNAFIKGMSDNNVHYYMIGHDHMHDRSIITTTDGTSGHVQQVLCESDSSKFYIPLNPSNDDTYDVPAAPAGFGVRRQTQLAQERNTIGYYLYTVDGPRVTVTYYSAEVYPTYSSGEYLMSSTPVLNFVKRESFGYSLNGKEFVVGQGQPYTTVQDRSPNGTVTKLLAGINGRMDTDASLRPISNAVDTGWTDGTSTTASDILTLWGIAEGLGSEQTDVYVLSMSYDPNKLSGVAIQQGTAGIAVNSNGKWTNAVSNNFGGTKNFVVGPWKASYGLGTYGVDTATNTAWAVVNYNSSFAVASGL